MDATFRAWIVERDKQIYNMCFKYMKDEENAKQLKSTVVEKVWKNRQQFHVESGQDGFIRWVGTIVHNESVNYRRKPYNKHITQDITTIYNLDSGEDLEADLDSREKIKKILDFIKENWDESYFVIFSLIFIEGLKYEDAAEQVGIPLATVKTRIFRIRKSIQHLK